jgi:hypothetical protein
MYPEDQTPKQNSLGNAPKPARFDIPGQEPDKKKQPINTRLILWIAGAAFGLLLLVVLVVWVASLFVSSDKNDKSTSKTSVQTQGQTDEPAAPADKCASKQRRYKNVDLSLGFCYPNDWGNVAVQDAKFDPSDDGTRLRLSFSEKPQMHIGLVSDDWDTDAARDGVCSDPAQQELPDFASFSSRWATEGTGTNITSATRGLEVANDQYVIEEHVDDVLTNGACITGFNLTDGEVYRHAEASYSAPFSSEIATPYAHINDPTKLVPAADRTAFTDLVKSLHKE